MRWKLFSSFSSIDFCISGIRLDFLLRSFVMQMSLKFCSARVLLMKPRPWRLGNRLRNTQRRLDFDCILNDQSRNCPENLDLQLVYTFVFHSVSEISSMSTADHRKRSTDSKGRKFSLKIFEEEQTLEIEKVKDVKEQIVNATGAFGKWQLWKCLYVVAIIWMPASFHLLNMVFFRYNRIILFFSKLHLVNFNSKGSNWVLVRAAKKHWRN